MQVGTLIVVLAVHLTLGACYFDYPWYMSHPKWNLIPTDSCGKVAQDDVGTRVLGGAAAHIADYPWMAYVEVAMWNGTKRRSSLCGGSIISDKYILSAAHCFFSEKLKKEGFTTKGINVTLGEHNHNHVYYCRNNPCASPPFITVPAEEYTIHPAFARTNRETGVSNENDIALIRLAFPITFTDYIRPICLPTLFGTYMEHFAETHFKVAGWGRTKSDGGKSYILMAAQVPLVSKKECEMLHTKAASDNNLCPPGLICPAVISDKQICAGGIQGQGTCNGDSGGPLIMSVGMNPITHYVAGITSYGTGKKTSVADKHVTPHCGSGVPDVYTRVSEYIPWILDTIYY